jgi:hypothetical protein
MTQATPLNLSAGEEGQKDCTEARILLIMAVLLLIFGGGYYYIHW